MRYFALFSFFFNSFKFSFYTAIKVASFFGIIKHFSHTLCASNRVFILILQLSNLLSFNFGTWNDIIPSFALINKLSENLEILNVRMDSEHRKTFRGTWTKNSKFSQRSTMINCWSMTNDWLNSLARLNLTQNN